MGGKSKQWETNKKGASKHNSSVERLTERCSSVWKGGRKEKVFAERETVKSEQYEFLKQLVKSIFVQ